MSPLRGDPGFILALVLVCIYAAHRFNTPRTARSQTSRFQYYGSLVAYVLSCSGLFMLLTWFVETNPQAATFLGFGGGTPVPDEVKQFGAPLVAVLFMTALLPSFPMLREIDSRLLRLFHRMGSIPTGAAHWKEKMRTAEFAISPALLDSVRKYVADSSILDDEMAAELRTDSAEDSARYRFTRNLALYVALTNLPARPRFADEYPEEIEAFEKMMASFFAQSAGFFALTRQLAVQNLNPVPESVKNARDGYRSLCLRAQGDPAHAGAHDALQLQRALRGGAAARGARLRHREAAGGPHRAEPARA
jgi:hypothetical protein